MTRTELIAALEAAEGPSRELDLAIEELLRPGQLIQWYFPRYTESIDAALSFTPEGLKYCLGCLSNPRLSKRSAHPYHAWVGETETVYAATPAIALCIANLRALEAQND